MKQIIRNARSVCPVCLAPVSAKLIRYNDGIYLEKQCVIHGNFSVIVWRDKINFEKWVLNTAEIKQNENINCPSGCNGCAEHMQGSCCVIIEITEKCNLNCGFCFADAKGSADDKPLTRLKAAIGDIMSGGDKPLLQFSGGEPTLRDDLPLLIAYANSVGCTYTQLNTNGLRLADDEAYVKALADAGLSFVFMQFDGTSDDTYMALRGAPLYEQKLKAIKMCDKYGIGVTLVPTIVRGINDTQLGDIISFGIDHSPSVRGVHFQPVTFMGRYPQTAQTNEIRYTLDELISGIVSQSGIELANVIPSRCDHPLCGFHASFTVKDKKLHPLNKTRQCETEGMTSHAANREYVGRRWKREQNTNNCCCGNTDSLDKFLQDAETNSFTITAMDFQDAANLNIERLRRCSLHVYDNGVMKPFCAKYLTPITAGP